MDRGHAASGDGVVEGIPAHDADLLIRHVFIVPARLDERKNAQSPHMWATAAAAAGHPNAASPSRARRSSSAHAALIRAIRTSSTAIARFIPSAPGSRNSSGR